MTKFIVDFEFAGHIEVYAETDEAAKAKIESMALEELIEHIQSFNVGKHYIEKISE